MWMQTTIFLGVIDDVEVQKDEFLWVGAAENYPHREGELPFFRNMVSKLVHDGY